MVIFQPRQEFQRSCQHYLLIMLFFNTSQNFSSDFSSRSPQSCCKNSCQTCKFVYKTINSVVSSVSVTDVMSGSALLPFPNEAAWRSAQHDFPNLHRAFTYLKHGTRPSLKARNLKHLWRCLGITILDKQRLIIVNKEDPFASRRSLILVPHKLLPGITTVIHLYMKGSSKRQLKFVFNCHFFGINNDTIINHVVDQCSQCNALKSIPKEVFDQSSSLASNSPSEVFFTDILR